MAKKHMLFVYFLLANLLNIRTIPWYAIKTKTSVTSIHNEVYLCNMIFQTNVPSFAPSLFPIDHHCELQSEFFDIVAFVRIVCSSCRVLRITNALPAR